MTKKKLHSVDAWTGDKRIQLVTESILRIQEYSRHIHKISRIHSFVKSFFPDLSVGMVFGALPFQACAFLQ